MSIQHDVHLFFQKEELDSDFPKNTYFYIYPDEDLLNIVASLNQMAN